MRENRLTPVSESSHDPSGKLPAERAKAQLERHTRYWPMIISQTTIFNMQAVSDTEGRGFYHPSESSVITKYWDRRGRPASWMSRTVTLHIIPIIGRLLIFLH